MHLWLLLRIYLYLYSFKITKELQYNLNCLAITLIKGVKSKTYAEVGKCWCKQRNRDTISLKGKNIRNKVRIISRILAYLVIIETFILKILYYFFRTIQGTKFLV